MVEVVSRMPQGIEEQDLKERLELESAEGSVYLKDQKPFFQVHLFPDSYSLIWQPELEPTDLNSLISEMHREAIENSNRSRGWPLRVASLGYTRERKRGKGLVRVEKDYKIDANKPEKFLPKLVRYLEEAEPVAVDMHTRLSFDKFTPEKFSFWSDTRLGPKTYMETGINAAYGLILPEKELGRLLRGTSSVFSEWNRDQVSGFLEEVSEKHQLKTPKKK